MKFWNARYPIAIDLSDGAEMCALQLAAPRGVAVVRAAARRDVRTGDGGAPADGDVRDFIRDVLRSRAFRGRAVALLPPVDAVRSYPLRVEVGKEENFEAALVRHAASDLKISVDEWSLDYASVGPPGPAGKGTRDVLLFAARNEDVSRYLNLVKQAGGVLEVINSSASALVRAYTISGAKPNPVLLCNVGRSGAALVVASCDSILAHRNANWGTERLCRKLIDNLGVSRQSIDADFLLRKHGLLHAVAVDADSGSSGPTDDTARTVGQLLAPLADELVRELHNLVGYVRSGAPDVVMDGLFLYGRGARVNGLAEYIARELNVEGRSMNPLERLGWQHAQVIPGLADEGTAYALALGLAMRRIPWL